MTPTYFEPRTVDHGIIVHTRAKGFGGNYWLLRGLEVRYQGESRQEARQRLAEHYSVKVTDVKISYWKK